MLWQTWHALYGNANPRTDSHIDPTWGAPQHTPQHEDIREEQVAWMPVYTNGHVYTNDFHDLGYDKIDWGAPENAIQYDETWEEQETWRPKYTNDLRDFEYEFKAIF